MPIQKQIRKDNYNRLKEVGFTSREANKYKDRSQRLINFLIGLKRENSMYLEERILKALSKGEEV